MEKSMTEKELHDLAAAKRKGKRKGKPVRVAKA
jgi:hypothetical protein